jgi:pimeloyl-ACP methyl ester carboxylesterase
MPRQDIRFCTASDGVRIAFTTVGSGPTLVKTANWMNHLEYDWESQIWRHVLHALTAENRLVRYDERGTGLSDWEVEDFSLEAFVDDLESVVEAAGLDRFPLFGMSQGCAISIAYAARHPERVSHLVLYGGYADGPRMFGGSAVAFEALVTLVRHGWGRTNPAFRQIFTSKFLPDATSEQVRWFNDLQRNSVSSENAARILRAMAAIDVTHLLAQVRVPTLVLHCRHDAAVPLKAGREMAAGIPGARFVVLEGRNHVLLESDPVFQRYVDEIKAFLKS